MPTRKLLLVEDDYFMRTSLSTYLTNAGYEVIETSFAAEALDKAYQTQPAVAVVDIVIPADITRERGDIYRSEGLVLVRQLKQFNPQMGVVILSAHEDRGPEVLDMLRTMRGLVYQVKGLRQPQQLEEAIRMAARGDVWLDPDVDLIGSDKLSDFLLNLSSCTEHFILERAFTKLDTLTSTENIVLEKVGQAYSRKQIAQEMTIELGTVTTHLNNIYSKLFDQTLEHTGLNKSVLLAKIALIDRAKKQGK